MLQTYFEALENATKSESEYVTSRCLVGLYVPLLLNTGFGFANNSKHIYVPEKIAGETPGIALQRRVQFHMWGLTFTDITCV